MAGPSLTSGLSQPPSTPHHEAHFHNSFGHVDGNHIPTAPLHISQSSRFPQLDSSLYSQPQPQPNPGLYANVNLQPFNNTQNPLNALQMFGPYQGFGGVLPQPDPSMNGAVGMGGLNNGAMNMAAMNLNALQQPNAQFIASLVDAMRFQAQNGPLVNGDQQYQPLRQPLYQNYTSMSPPSSAGLVNPPSSVDPFATSVLPWSRSTHGTPVSQEIPPSLSRLESPSSSFSEQRSPRKFERNTKQRRSGGSGQRVANRSPRQLRPRPQQELSHDSSPSEQESIYISPVGSPPPRSQPPPTGSPRKAGEIFRSEDGEPLRFFVQVDMRNRLKLIQKIKVRCSICFLFCHNT